MVSPAVSALPGQCQGAGSAALTSKRRTITSSYDPNTIRTGFARPRRDPRHATCFPPADPTEHASRVRGGACAADGRAGGIRPMGRDPPMTESILPAALALVALGLTTIAARRVRAE